MTNNLRADDGSRQPLSMDSPSDITAEKEFLRSRIFDFPIASISHRNGLVHRFDHLQLRSTRKQCDGRTRKH